MIHVDRTQVAPPDSLTMQDGAGLVETKQAIDFYSDDQNLDKSFDFKQYKADSVKDALKVLFRGKCAYCEGSVSSGHDGDVEHFRPKGAVEVNGGQVKPGYYWLAAQWENLYLSCQHCNQLRKHRLLQGGVQKTGKSDKFPVVDENERVTHAKIRDNLLNEQGEVDTANIARHCQDEPILLIDPCKDNPLKHLQFLDDGAICSIFGPNNELDTKGKASIETFGLYRGFLVNDRATEIEKIKMSMDGVRDILSKIERNPNNSDFVDLLNNAVKRLEEHCKPIHRFSGMARQLVDAFMENELT